MKNGAVDDQSTSISFNTKGSFMHSIDGEAVARDSLAARTPYQTMTASNKPESRKPTPDQHFTKYRII
jgi:hypothetical protein